jgi:hypothetical protein
LIGGEVLGVAVTVYVLVLVVALVGVVPKAGRESKGATRASDYLTLGSRRGVGAWGSAMFDSLHANHIGCGLIAGFSKTAVLNPSAHSLS